MKNRLNCIMLVDDNPDDNFFHEREIKKIDLVNTVITKNSGREALEYLISKEDPHSDLIFLDINMPGMNGWQFLEAYERLDKVLQGRAIIIMLTTSDNPHDLERAKKQKNISGYITKPLTKESLTHIIDKYFKMQIPTCA